MPLWNVPLYRNDHEIFDPEKWIAGPAKYDIRAPCLRVLWNSPTRSLY